MLRGKPSLVKNNNLARFKGINLLGDVYMSEENSFNAKPVLRNGEVNGLVPLGPKINHIEWALVHHNELLLIPCFRNLNLSILQRIC